MSDARVDIERGKALVDMDTPALAPLLDLRRRVPRADLRTEPGFATFADDDLAHRQHDMGVGFGLPVGADIPMDIEVGDHAGIDELALHKVAGELDALRLIHLARDRELDLARKLCVFALPERLDILPKAFISEEHPSELNS